MANDFDQIVSIFKRKNNDVSAAAALVYAGDIYKEVIAELAIKTDEKDISQTVNIDRYSIGSDVMRVLYVYHYQTASDFIRLRETSLDQLDYDDDRWHKTLTTGRPLKYAIEFVDDTAKSAVAQMVVRPIPSVSTVGGYPEFRLGYCNNETPIGATLWPPSLLSPRVIVEGMNWLFAKDYKAVEAQVAAEAIYRHEIDRNRHHLKRLTPRIKTILRPTAILGRRVV